MIGRVLLFSRERHFGFCVSGEDEIYFHAQNFHRITPGGPPPILGERVEIQAKRVSRIEPPILLEGVVHSFDSRKGWGFIKREEETFFLHKSDLLEGWLPVIGGRVQFYAGEKLGKPRACWIVTA